jgi:hypothetical protein
MIVDCLVEKNLNVFIEEKANRDLSCILTSLVKIILYKNYRTIVGFQNLIQKEWFLVGHMFAKRLEIVTNKSTSVLSKSETTDQAATNQNEQSNDPVASEFTPVFSLFLDCVWQLIDQYPDQFEFNDAYLVHLYDYSLSGLSVTFSFNGASDWLKYTYEYPSYRNYFNYLLDTNWDWSTHVDNVDNPEKTIFLNENFTSDSKSHVLRPYSNIYEIKFWSTCYLRWYNLNHDQVKFCESQSVKLKQAEVQNKLSNYNLTTELYPAAHGRNIEASETIKPFSIVSRRTADGNLETTL